MGRQPFMSLPFAVGPHEPLARRGMLSLALSTGFHSLVEWFHIFIVTLFLHQAVDSSHILPDQHGGNSP